MFIPLHHFESGELFFLPVSHFLIIDTMKIIDKNEPRAMPKTCTKVQTIIQSGDKTLAFQVRESPEEVATLTNEMLASGRVISRKN